MNLKETKKVIQVSGGGAKPVESRGAGNTRHPLRGCKSPRRGISFREVTWKRRQGASRRGFPEMDSRGVMFTLMTLVLLTTLLSLHEIGPAQDRALAESASHSNAFRKVSEKYSNMENNFSGLATSQAEREIDQRVLPFTYSIDANTFDTNFSIPLKQDRIDAYLETINALRVFIEDTNYSNHFDSLKADINTLTPSSWGGSDKNISFTTEPHCMKYSILDANTVTFEFACEGFDYNSARKHDLNLVFAQGHDFNSMNCTFNGNPDCFSDSFNQADSRPFLALGFDETNCPECALPQTSVSGHFDPAQQSTITVSCSGAACKSPDITLDFSGKTLFDYRGQEIKARYSVDLNAAIKGFRFNDVNILVANTDFGAKRGN